MMGEGVQKTYKERDIYRHLMVEKWAKNRSLRSLAKEFGVSHGVIHRILKGQFPKRKRLRQRLGLSLLETVEVCRTCGEAHVTKRCTKNTNTRPPRIAIRLDDPESAADSIIKNMGIRERDELIELLMERCDTVV